MHFFGAHEHDGIWHVALINSSFRQIPFIFPTYSGAILSGYNFLLDIVLWIFVLFGLSAWDLYFRIQPTVWFVSFSTVLYFYSKSIHKDKMYTAMVFFFMFFASSFGFIIQYARNGNVWGSSGNPTMQGALGMTNPQFMWSTALLLLLTYFLHKRQNLVYVPLLVFAIAGLKIYAILPLAIIIGAYIVLYVRKKYWSRALVIAFSSLVALAIAYFTFYFGNPSGGISLDPIAIPKQIIEDPNMWPMPELVKLWYPLSSTGSVGPKMVWVSLQIIGYFLFFNYGMRLIGAFASIYYVATRKRYLSFHTLLWTAIVIFCSLMPILFVQSGDWWNTIQFMYFGFIFGNLLLAETIYIAWHKTRYFAVVLIILCFLTFLPAQADLLRTFMLGGSSHIASEEIEILDKLKNMPDGIVLTQPFEKYIGNELPDIYDTAYVTAMSGKQSYYADKKQLELLNVDHKTREAKMLDVKECLDLTNIRYVYLRKNVRSFSRLDSCVAKSPMYIVKLENKKAKLWMRL